MRCSSTSSLIAFILPLSALALPVILSPSAALQQLNNGLNDATDGLRAAGDEIANLSANVVLIPLAKDMIQISNAVRAGQRPADAEYVDTAHLHARHCLTFLLTA